MSHTRKEIATFVAHKSVDQVFVEVNASTEDIGAPECRASVDKSLDAMLLEIATLEKEEEICKAQALFPALKDDPKQALAAKRRMARRASEANMHAGWLVAQLAHKTAGTCEAYRKASTMRLGPAQIEQELAELCTQAGLSLTPCTKGENGKLQKVKASAAPVMALEKLQAARQAVRHYQIAEETCKAAQVKTKELEALRAADLAIENSRKNKAA